MIKSVTAINYLGEAVTMNLLEPDNSGFEVRDIQGLGPVTATINQSKIATMSGMQYNSATVDGRNIVLSLGLLPNPTVEEARQRSYRYFPVTQEVTLLIETDRRIVTTSGRVESNAPSIFSKDSQTQISIVCEDAYFYDAGPRNRDETVFYATQKKFEFPFSNESLTQPLIEMGDITGVLAQTIDYVGDAEVGVTIIAEALGNVVGLGLYNERTNEAIVINHDRLVAMTGSGIIAGDRIEIVTDIGRKSATLIRNGARLNILNALGRNINWPRLRKGPNTFSYTASSGVRNIQIRVENFIIYEGV